MSAILPNMIARNREGRPLVTQAAALQTRRLPAPDSPLQASVREALAPNSFPDT